MSSGSSDQRRAHWALLALRLGYAVELVLLTAVTLIWVGPNREPSFVIWGLLIAPLLLCLPAIWFGWVRAQAWLSFLILLYFAAAVTGVFVPGRELLSALEVAATSWVFVAALCYMRWGARAERAAAEAQSAGVES